MHQGDGGGWVSKRNQESGVMVGRRAMNKPEVSDKVLEVEQGAGLNNADMGEGEMGPGEGWIVWCSRSKIMCTSPTFSPYALLANCCACTSVFLTSSSIFISAPMLEVVYIAAAISKDTALRRQSF